MGQSSQPDRRINLARKTIRFDFFAVFACIADYVFGVPMVGFLIRVIIAMLGIMLTSPKTMRQLELVLRWVD